MVAHATIAGQPLFAVPFDDVLVPAVRSSARSTAAGLRVQ